MNRMKANDAYIKRLSFGRAIRKFRERKNMSQEDLALSAQMDRSYVGRVERGEKSVSLDKIKISEPRQDMAVVHGFGSHPCRAVFCSLGP